MGFESLQISEPLKKALSSSVNSGRFPHAAILEDEESERLMDTAKTLAAALVCSGDDKPCGRCIKSCKWYFSRRGHPLTRGGPWETASENV